jgi:DNA replicative helicase MCM subunit Mcm2 (Cdc46/Mcm family)
MRLSPTVTDLDANNAAELIEGYLNKIAGNGDGTYDIDKISTGISSKDRNKLDVIRAIMNEFGETGLSYEEIVQHAANQGLSRPEADRALETLSLGGDLYKSPSGIYKKA